MAQIKVFISHSHQDNAFAEALASVLREYGAEVWFDEMNIGSGNLLSAINRALIDSNAYIILLSPASLSSTFVRMEIDFAFALHIADRLKMILPIVVEPVKRQDLPIALMDIPFIERTRSYDYLQPYPPEEAIRGALLALGLTTTSSVTEGGILPSHRSTIGDSELTDRFNNEMDGGDLLREQGKLDEALIAYENAISIDPNVANAWALKGATLDEVGHPDESLDAFDRALQLDPGLETVWLRKIAILRAKERFEETLSACDLALARFPKLLSALLSKGYALWALKRFEEAITVYEDALSLDPMSLQDMARPIRALIRRRA